MPAYRLICAHHPLREGEGDPLGLEVLSSSTDPAQAAEQQAIDSATFGAMASRFDGQAGAYAYLLFILLYAPCVAATAAIYREAGPRWMLYAVLWTTGIAYSTATVFYQLVRFGQHPLSSTLWILVLVGIITASILLMRHFGKHTGDLQGVTQA